MTTYRQWDIVVVPFPFVDLPKAKARPALVLSNAQFNGKGLVILSMITTKKTAPFHMDVIIRDLRAAGVDYPSIVRWKVFTLDSEIIRKKIGHLSPPDTKNCRQAMESIFSYPSQKT